MRPPLRVASHLAPGVLPLYAFLADYLADSLGRRAEFTVATSYERCAQDVDDICFVCSVPYLPFAELGHIHMEVVAAPVLIWARYAGRPIYFSDVVVYADSRYNASLTCAARSGPTTSLSRTLATSSSGTISCPWVRVLHSSGRYRGWLPRQRAADGCGR